MACAGRLQAFIKEHRVPAAAGVWDGVASQLKVLAAAYRVPLPSRTP